MSASYRADKELERSNNCSDVSKTSPGLKCAGSTTYSRSTGATYGARSTLVTDERHPHFGVESLLRLRQDLPTSAPIPRRTMPRAIVSDRGCVTSRCYRGEIRGDGAKWRQRFASTKALLGFGTDAACWEALDLLQNFMTATACKASGVGGNLGASITDRTISAHTRPSSENDELLSSIGEEEFRLCAQSVVLLLRTTLREALVWRRLKPSKLLVASVKQSVECAAHSRIGVHMVSYGVLGQFRPLLQAYVKRKAASDITFLMHPALQAICSLTSAFETSQERHESFLHTIMALTPITSDYFPSNVKELAIEAIHNLTCSGLIDGVLVPSGTILGLSQACRSDKLCTAAILHAVKALKNLANKDRLKDRVAEHGGMQALLHLLTMGNSISSACAGVVRDALTILISSPKARSSVVANAGTIKKLVSTLINENDERRQAAGWILVSLSIDPALCERAVRNGVLPGLIEYAHSSDVRQQEEAVWALANLSSASSNALPMARAQMPQKLISMLAKETNVKIRMQIAWAIANLAVDHQLRGHFCESGAMSVLLVHFEQCTVRATKPNADDESRINAATQTLRAIANLSNETSMSSLIVEAQGLPRIVEAVSTAQFTEAALRVLVNLTRDNTDIVNLCVESGIVDPLVLALRHGSLEAKHEGLQLAACIAVSHGKALTTTEVLHTILGFLGGLYPAAVQNRAACVLRQLSCLGMQAKMAIVSSGILPHLGRLDLSRGAEMLQKTCSEIMAALSSILTPSSRRALLQASLLPRDVRPILCKSSRSRKRSQHRRPSPLTSNVNDLSNDYTLTQWKV